MEHFFSQNSLNNSLECIFFRACSKNASKIHKICYMTPPRSSQDASRTAQDGFCIRFGRQLGAKLEPCWPLFPPKTLPWRLQDDPRCPQKSFGSPKTAQEASKPALEPSRPQFWPIFGPFLVHIWLIFWLIFDTFFIDFSFHFNVKKQAFQHQKNNTLMLWCFVTLLLNHMRSVLGAVAGPQLCCALVK